MYQLFGAAKLATWFTSLSSVIAILTMVIGLASGRTVPGGTVAVGWWVWTSLGTGATLGGLILFGLGSSGLFPWLCRCRPLCGVFPDLDGTWKGTLESNWPQVSTRLPRAPLDGPLQPVAVTLRIKARLLSIHLTLETETRYSDSETVLVGIGKSGGETPSLTYVYRSRVPGPLPTDTQSHHGAARLELRDEDGVPTLRGNYWTDRNWERGFNTAGMAVFRKEKSFSMSRV